MSGPDILYGNIIREQAIYFGFCYSIQNPGIEIKMRYVIFGVYSAVGTATSGNLDFFSTQIFQGFLNLFLNGELAVLNLPAAIRAAIKRNLKYYSQNRILDASYTICNYSLAQFKNKCK